MGTEEFYAIVSILGLSLLYLRGRCETLSSILLSLLPPNTVLICDLLPEIYSISQSLILSFPAPKNVGRFFDLTTSRPMVSPCVYQLAHVVLLHPLNVPKLQLGQQIDSEPSSRSQTLSWNSAKRSNNSSSAGRCTCSGCPTTAPLTRRASWALCGHHGSRQTRP